MLSKASSTAADTVLLVETLHRYFAAHMSTISKGACGTTTPASLVPFGDAGLDA